MPPKYKRTTKAALAHTKKRYPKERETVKVQIRSTIIDQRVSRSVIKLGSMCRDSGSGVDGMVTHMQYEHTSNLVFYNFQPRGLNPKDGSPVKALWVPQSRIVGGEHIPEPKLPIEVLGTEVMDDASGFKGIAVSLCLHISGCVHVSVQPQGKCEKTGGAFSAYSFDIRRLSGVAIAKMTEAEREKDQQVRPSPGEMSEFSIPPVSC